MGAVTNLVVVLSVAGWATAWEALPNIPAQRRAEYYLLHSDGGYKYGYDTGLGSSHVVMGNPANEVRGSYAYQGPSGPVQLDYTAGVGGFVTNLQEANSGAVEAKAAVHSHGGSQQVHSQSAGAEVRDENADASYAFTIDTDEYKRQESSDRKGNVQGRYSYSGNDGNQVSVSYTAGAGKGFVVETKGAAAGAQSAGTFASRAHTSQPRPVIPAPAAPYQAAVPVVPYSGPFADIVSTGPALDGSYSFSYETPESDRKEAADANGLVLGRYSFLGADGVRRTVDYRAGAMLGFVPQGDGLNPPLPAPAAPAVTAYNTASSSGYQASSHSSSSSHQSEESSAPADASYAFSYQADDHSRQEKSDAAGNVAGEYSFTDPEGQSRTVQYEAGANKGFVVKEGAVTKSASRPAPRRPAAPAPVAAPRAPVPVPASPFAAQHSASHQAVVSSPGAANTDGSYSFSYDAEDHSRKESADANGNVRGYYSFKADDGVSRKVEYEAGANKGFVAKGDHLQVAPAVVASSGNAGSYSTNSASSFNAASATGGYVAQQQSADAPGDASYAFSYDLADHTRQESADPSGYVRGQYTFIADDGVSRSVQYEAGAGKGFVAQGEHLPTAGAAVVAAKTSGVSTGAWSGQAASSGWSGQQAATSGWTAPQAAADEASGDASYTYSYQTDTSSKSESSDAAGNVVGTFSYVGGDGQSRTLNYVAGPNSGFVANGAHLPLAPGAESGVVVAKSQGASAQLASSSWNSGSSVQGGAGSSWNSGSSVQGGAGSSWNSGSSVRTVPAVPATDFVLHKYLPPDSSHKFGYIFDTRV